jgi:2-polyprenyl-6-methoxyphenol hydroxylase-like FAD-dependent oxidoreductase
LSPHEGLSLGGGRQWVTFANGAGEPSITTDLLVGADGACSRVRPPLSDAKPAYNGLSYIETYLFESDTGEKASADVIGGGMLLALAPTKGIVAHREPGGVLHTYAALNKSRDWIDGIDFTDGATAGAEVAKEFAGWAPELTALITDGETAPVPRPIHALPREHRWDRVPGATLLGDAAHLTIPSGEGANLAMLDGADLAKAIAAHPGDMEAALTAYETSLFPRSALAATEADELHKLMFASDSPQRLVDMHVNHQPEA